MRRIFFGLFLCIGMLVASTTSASAAVLCHDDPTLGVSVPGVHLSTSITLLGSNVYATSGRGSTSFGFTIGT